ncbi:hypothetical protein BGZ52_005581 [Haplosporangium bisporale]|nr:hypothetical protein BGZ52_005581 [Haplosporangium bisporale]KAF9210426.1 hypothetical protein BGZ59_009462 [Podila verticillata]KFH72198.1 hypothetical protein MVEG_02489 [Podila verticillata NRRL 6337]
MDPFYSIQYPIRANASRLTITTTTTRTSPSSTSMDSSSHARSPVAATASERPTRYYFRNLEVDMELVSSGIAGHQKEGMPPMTHSACLEDAVDALGMSSSLADDDDNSSSDDGSSGMMSGRGYDQYGRNDWRSRMQISPPLSASSSSSFASGIEQNSGVDGGHARGLKVLDRTQFLMD